MNHSVEEHYNVNQDSIAHNTRRKIRVIEDATTPPPNQASTSNAVPHIPSAPQQQRQNNNKVDMNGLQVILTQPPTHEAPKASTREPNALFNVVD